MRPILFLVSAASSYRLQKFVAEQLVRDGRRVAFLYERGGDATFALLQRDAIELGAEVYALDAFTGASGRARPAWRRHPRLKGALAIWAAVTRLTAIARLKAWRYDAPLPADVFRLQTFRNELSSQLAAALAIFRQVDPAVMVASDDGISALLAVHAAARQAGVPVAVVPYGYGVRRDLEIALDAKAAHGQLVMIGGEWAEMIRAHAPQWIKRGAHEGALMYPESWILAAESLGITLRDAWIIHGGDATRLCVESAQMQRVYLDEGVPARKLAITGTPYCDVVVKALDDNPAARAALRQPRRIQAGRTRILVSWPPNYHGERSAFSEFASYREMSVATLGWLSRVPGCDVTVSLHPATLPEDRQALIDAGVPLTDDYVIALIAQHDVFVTYFSSTIRWAVAAGKPVINFDLYRIALAVYDSAPGVLRVASLADFQSAVTGLATSDQTFADVASRQIAVAADWGTLDGHNTASVAGEITRLAAQVA